MTKNSTIPISLKDYFDQFGFLYGSFLNGLYRNLSTTLNNIVDHNFTVSVDRDALVKKLNDFYPIKDLRKPRFCYSDEPFIHIHQSNVANHMGVASTGKSFHSEIESITKAFFEALERHSYMNFLPDGFLETSFEHIQNNCLDIYSLAGFSKDQKSRNGILQFNEHTKLRFFKGECLTDKSHRYIPLQLISQKYSMDVVGAPKTTSPDGLLCEPLLRSNITTGVAAGLSKEEVIYAGMLEIIERDAFMITYLNKTPRSLVDLEKTDIRIGGRHIVKSFKEHDLEVYTVRLLSDIPVHTIAVYIIDRTGKGPALAMGASAHHDFKRAILNAASEALTSRLYNKADNLFRLDVDVLLEKFKTKERKVFWSKQENLSKIQCLIDSPKEANIPKFEIENLNLIERVNYLTNVFKEKGYAVYYANITPPFLQKLGIEVGKVIIPEMQPMHLNEAYPAFGGERIRGVPLSLGYQPPKELNNIPHPFH